MGVTSREEGGTELSLEVVWAKSGLSQLSGCLLGSICRDPGEGPGAMMTPAHLWPSAAEWEQDIVAPSFLP